MPASASTTATEVIRLLDIADRALTADAAASEAKYASSVLNEAYRDWKDANGVENVDRGSEDWDLMLAATKPEYAEAEEAKRLERNARRRLQTAIARHRNASVS